MVDWRNGPHCSPNTRCNYYHKKAVKGQAVEDFLAEHPDPRMTKLYEDLPDEIAEIYITQTSFEELVWQLFFDGASRTDPRENIVAGGGVVLVSSQNYMFLVYCLKQKRAEV